MRASYADFDFAPLAGTPNLAEQVAGLLRERIAAGKHAPQTRLPSEAALAAQFGVSRTVVREAVSRLKSEGLVSSRQGSGVFVRKDAQPRPLAIDAQAARSEISVLQIAELRRAIEAEAAALAAERRDKSDITAMRAALKDIDRAVARGEDGVMDDVRFHRLIAASARNPYFIAVLSFLGQYLNGATRVTRANEARRADFAAAVKAEHAAVLEAIIAGDAKAARRAAARHMDNAARRISVAGAAFWEGREAPPPALPAGAGK
jgi:GntR family transcriptional repressor for pyruvate dehydrogenase complex